MRPATMVSGRITEEIPKATRSPMGRVAPRINESGKVIGWSVSPLGVWISRVER